ncbi:hypothetical protein KUF71_021993 [Frankliniella fusca]|uniref:Uncharacterized protein n=1 Tax=Frankliniella fusca TaxID=407009 RepID=A0AAE1LAF6_9NEOP|nr:hypothetical protein KUF71_021993 [Frankliniella fusca]
MFNCSNIPSLYKENYLSALKIQAEAQVSSYLISIFLFIRKVKSGCIPIVICCMLAISVVYSLKTQHAVLCIFGL